MPDATSGIGELTGRPIIGALGHPILRIPGVGSSSASIQGHRRDIRRFATKPGPKFVRGTPWRLPPVGHPNHESDPHRSLANLLALQPLFDTVLCRNPRAVG